MENEIKIDYCKTKKGYSGSCELLEGWVVGFTGDFEGFKQFVQESIDFDIKCAKEDNEDYPDILKDDYTIKYVEMEKEKRKRTTLYDAPCRLVVDGLLTEATYSFEEAKKVARELMQIEEPAKEIEILTERLKLVREVKTEVVIKES